MFKNLSDSLKKMTLHFIWANERKRKIIFIKQMIQIPSIEHINIKAIFSKSVTIKVCFSYGVIPLTREGFQCHKILIYMN
jgi:hypothetical protein